MKKKVFSTLLASTLIACFLILPSCNSKIKPVSSSSIGSSVASVNSDLIESELSAESVTSTDSSKLSTSSKSSKSTSSKKTSSRKSGEPIVPDDDNIVFPSKWETTKKVSDIPANLAKNLKSGKVTILSDGKMKDVEKAELKATFKKLTGKTLELNETIVDWNSLQKNLQTMVMAKRAPDYFSIYNGAAVFMRNKNLSRDINDYINMNDAAWESSKSISRPMFYNNKLHAASVKDIFTGGFVYNKTMMNQAGLEDPWELYKKGKWDVETFMNYAEKLTKKNSEGMTTVYGVSMIAYGVLQMGIATGEDIIKINKDGTFDSNISSSVWTRYAGYAKKINDFGSNDPLTVVGAGFDRGRCAMKETPWWLTKRQANTGWVPNPKDNSANKYYQAAESICGFLPENSNNPWGGAALMYSLRYQEVSRDPEYIKIDKDYYANNYGIKAEEYDYYTGQMKKDLTPVNYNWRTVPGCSDTEYLSIWTEPWSTVRERIAPKLKAALKIQNQ